ncbi:hypothetical protein [Natrinema sp. SYSU A 869]|uniref:hypothetical protein n=1 Tax=Natrinema sp. SYSU A 869 TaxID=2871694 RepID=UPI001CA3B84A|nr:hypothetical protein [Natrinema sp. SYSU A 869]
MSGSNEDDFVTENEFERRMNVMDRRLSKCEKMQKQILDQLRDMTARSGEGSPLEVYSNPDSEHHVIPIVEDLQTNEEGAHMDEIKQVAQEEGLLKFETKTKVRNFVDEGYLLEKQPNRFKVVKYPEEKAAEDTEHPEDRFLSDTYILC